MLRIPEQKAGKAFPRSIRQALLLFLLLIILSMLAVWIYYSFGIVQRQYSRENKRFRQMAEAQAERVEEEYKGLKMDVLQVAYSNVCQKVLLSGESREVISNSGFAANTIQDALSRNNNLRDIVLLARNGRKLSGTDQYFGVVEQALKDEAPDYILSGLLFKTDILFRNQLYYAGMLPIYDIEHTSPVRENMIICSAVGRMEDLLASISLKGWPESVSVFVSDASGKTIASTRALSSQEETLLSADFDGDGYVRSGSALYSVHSHKISGSDWRLVFLYELSSHSGPFLNEDMLPALIALGAILLIALMMFIVLYRIGRSVHSVVSDIRSYQRTGKPISPPGIEELSVITEELNRSLKELEETHRREQKLLRSNYESELYQKQAELLMYRSQINPHFLFNTLETARSMARHYNVPPIEKLITGMSTMFHASLYAPLIIPLEEELEALEGYLSVIEARFPGRYRVKEHIDQAVLRYPVLSVMLQPILENTIKHAFKSARSGCILIRIALDPAMKERMKITVADNGTGMTEEQIAGVIENMKKMEVEKPVIVKDSHQWLVSGKNDYGLGLSNIYHRLKLCFGEHAHIRIRSRAGYYTVVDLLIPLRAADDTAIAGTDQ